MKKNGRDGIADIEAVQKKKWENDDMKKRILAVFLAVGILASLLSGCGKKSSYVTRGEWVAMLGAAFGLDTPLSNTPVYSDVAAGNPIFPYVQSTAEWSVLTVFDEDKLQPDKLVTGQEVAATAAVAAGFYGEDTDEAVVYAQRYGIVPEKLPKQMTAEECAAVVETAKSVFVENPGEDTRVAVFAEGVADLRGLGPEWVTAGADRLIVHTAAAFDGSTATLTVSGQPVSISVGSIVLAVQSGEFPLERAYKITGIQEENGQVVFLAAQPEFSEIYDKVDIHTTVSLQDGYIIWEDGVAATEITPSELSATGQSYHVELLANQPVELTPETEDDNKISETWGFEFGDGVKLRQDNISSPVLGNSAQAKLFKASSFGYAGTPSLADFDGNPHGFTWNLNREKKYDKGYKLTGEISFDLSATTDVDYEKLNIFDNEINLWPKQASVTLDSNITTQLRYEGEWSEDIKLATLIIPIPGTGFSVNGSLYLCLGISGSIEFKLVLEDEARATWTTESGYRRGDGKHTATSEVTGAVDLSAGGKVAIDLCACNIKIIGAALKAEGVLEAEGKQVGECESITVNGAPARHYTEKLQLSANIYLPIVSLTVSGPDFISELFGLEATFPIKKKDVEHPIPIFASDWTIWEATVGEDGQILEEEFPGLKVDISPYLGDYHYFANFEGEIGTALTLAKDGSITGEIGYAWPGGSFSDPLEGSGLIPIEMTENDDGSIHCVLSHITGEDEEGYYESSITYTIYPPGVPTGDNFTASFDDATRLYYCYSDGGIGYYWYYQTQNSEQAAASFDELWDRLGGTWQFEEYQYRGKPAPQVDHTMEFRYNGGTPCIHKDADRDDGYIPDRLLYEFAAIDDLHYNAYVYKPGFYGDDFSNWGNDVQLVWYSFDLSNLEQGELIVGYHMTLYSGHVDNDHIYRYRLTKS